MFISSSRPYVRSTIYYIWSPLRTHTKKEIQNEGRRLDFRLAPLCLFICFRLAKCSGGVWRYMLYISFFRVSALNRLLNQKCTGANIYKSSGQRTYIKHLKDKVRERRGICLVQFNDLCQIAFAKNNSVVVHSCKRIPINVIYCYRIYVRMWYLVEFQ